MKMKLPWIIAASAVVLIGIAAAIVLPQVFRTLEVPETATEETESETEPGEGLVYDGILYWNVDRLTYAGKSETGMSSRVPVKEDGLYHILFAENGRQVERRTADKRLVNMIDSYDVMGLRFDENRLITEVIPITKIIDEFSINGLYVKTVLENGQFELNTSETLEARQNIVLDLTGYQVYDVSGVSKNFVGQPIGIAGLQMRDRIFGIEMPDGSKIIYVTERGTAVQFGHQGNHAGAERGRGIRLSICDQRRTGRTEDKGPVCREFDRRQGGHVHVART